jgi:hypothetical protein
VTILKFASPLEIFSRIVGGGSAPPDLTPTPDPAKWPDVLWPPIEKLRTNWLKYAGTVNAPGNCAGMSGNAFCDAVHDVKELMNANYENYKKIGCTNSPIPLTDELMISHVYGWAPFTENGCAANANNLENTPGYTDNNHARYLAVKQEFDKLNYGAYTKAFYNFNPWVAFIHGADYLNAPNVYAYSVDDAVGNIQAEGQGFIIDIGSTQNLENQLPASPPINISLGFDPKSPVRFASYRVCKNDPARDKPVNPHFPSFIISANDPKNCPVYLLDNKTPTPQSYTFTVTQPPRHFPVFQNPSDAHWSQETAGIIDCSGNTAFDQSSQLWCCQKLAGESRHRGLCIFNAGPRCRPPD